MQRSIYSSPLIVFALAAACVVALQSPAWGAAKGPTKSQSFPAEFRGDWYDVPGACDKDKIALQIGGTSLNYFDEFSGQLIRIIRQTDRNIDYVARYDAEGHSWESTETLSLSPDGKELKLQPERTSPGYFGCTISSAN
jgi:hypothetical protein